MRNSTYLIATLLSGVAFVSPAFAQAAPNNTTTPSQDPNVQAAPTDQTPATQQIPTTQQAAATNSGESIVITGSRIVSPNITSLAPVQVIGEQQINQSGALNIQELLQQNPNISAPLISPTASTFFTTGAGAATTDIHDLGINRTLVLINGRRVVGGLPGSTAVDLNDIPTQFIERVDILTGGASSLYGSDAVAGVMNFVYKRNFEGLLAEGQYGLTEQGDSQRYQLSATVGGNFMDNRGNIMVHVGYTNDKGLMARDRADTAVDFISNPVCFDPADPSSFKCVVSPFFSSFPLQGRFSAGPYTFTYGPTGQLQPCSTTNGSTCDSQVLRSDGTVKVPRLTDVNGGFGTGPNGFNRQFYRALSTPVKRYIVAEQAHFDITDNIRFISEATYVKTSAIGQQEPFALADANIFPATGRVPIGTIVDGQLVVNPLIPAPIVAVATDKDGDGIPDFGFARRLGEVGTRHQEVERNFFRIVTGLEGNLLNDRWHWDLTYNYGHSSEMQHASGQVNTVNFRNALEAIPGPDGTVVCADPQAQAEGCVPINIFGLGSITPAALAYVQADQEEQASLTQQVWNANLSGALIDLPAGPLGLAVGAEYRKESSSQDWDALTNAGLNAANAAPDTKGSFNVKEVYGEVNIPVLHDLPFTKQLNLRAAGRLSKYSLSGSTTTWSLGGDWAPIDAIRFRATYAKAVRAPNIGELFTGPSQTFPPGIVDPCEGVTLATPGTLGTQCRADPGVLLNIQQNGEFTLNQADIQGISGFNSGNPNLKPEASRSLTAGVVINPRSVPALRNLVLTADYYDIKVSGAIVPPPRNFTLQQCYVQANPFFCGLVIRRPVALGPNSPGSINLINAPLFNGGRLESKGIEMTAAYRTGLGFVPGMNMSVNLAWNHFIKGFVTPVPGADPDPYAGEIGTPRDRANGTVAFNTTQWGVSFTGTYIGKAYEDNQFLAQFDLGPHSISVPAIFYLDSQVRFTPVRQYEFYVGVNNLLNTKPPQIESGFPGNTTGSHTDAAVYDIFGRRYYAGVRLRF